MQWWAKASVICVGLSALVVAAAPPAVADEAVTVKIEKAEQVLHQTEAELAVTQQDDAELRGSLEVLDKKVRDMSAEAVVIAARIHAFEEHITTLETQLRRIDAAREEQQTGLQARQQAMAKSLAALQRLRKTPPSAILLMPISVSESMRASALLGWVTSHFEQEAATLRVALQEAAELERDAEQRREELAKALGGLQAERNALDALVEQTREKKALALSAQRQTGERLRGLAEKAATLNELIRDLEKESAEEEEKARRQAAESHVDNQRLVAYRADTSSRADGRRAPMVAGVPSTPGTSAIARAPEPTISAPNLGDAPKRITAYVATEVTPSPVDTPPETPPAPAKSLASAHGQFLFPARGQLVSHFGQTTAPGVNSRGIVIETRPAARVVAPFDGTIAFAGPFKDYGQLLIIAHGEGYHTLLSGLSRIDAIVGQRVLAGEPVGVMASAGDANPQLYVEIRREGRPINPLAWLAAGDSKVSG